MNQFLHIKEDTLQMSMGQTHSTSFFTNRGTTKLRIDRRAIVRATAPLAAITFLLAAPSACRIAQAQTDDSYSASATGSTMSKGPIIDLDVVNASLLTVVQALKLQSRAQIVVVNSKRYQPVTLTVTTSLGDALQYVAQSAGAIVTRDANGVYTFQPATDSSGAATIPVSAMPASYSPAAMAAQPTTQEPMHMERIVTRFVDPNYILVMLNDPAGFRDVDPISNPLSDPYIAQSHQIAHPFVSNPSVSEINPYTASNTGSYQQPGVPLQNGSYSGAANQANRSNPETGSQAQQFAPGQFGGFNPTQTINPGGINVNPFAPNATGGSSVGFGNPNGTATAPGQGGTSLRPQGIDSIIANEQDNSLIVRGTPEGITELKQIIGFLDRAPRQVQIKVEFITTDVSNIDQFGINWEFLPFSNVAAGFNGGGAATGVTGTSFLTFAQGNVATQLLATLTTTNSKVVASPIITTTNNVRGRIDFSSEIPYTTSSTVAQGSGNAISNTSVNFLTLNNFLEITPRINGDDSISLSLNPTLTAVSGAAISGGAPPTTQQSVNTYRTVANGETMVIGGLVQKNVTNGHSYIPFLSQLPIIGSIFRTRNLSVSDSELLIFVTPTILPPIGSGEAQTPTEAGSAPSSGDSTAGVGVSP